MVSDSGGDGGIRSTEIIRHLPLRVCRSTGRFSGRHFADTMPESSAQMRDDIEATSSAIWCWAKIWAGYQRSGRDVAR